MLNNLAFIYNDNYLVKIYDIKQFLMTHKDEYDIIYIINFSDDDLYNLFDTKISNLKIIDAHHIYKNTLKNTNSFFEDVLIKIKINFNNLDFWLTSLSECNFARSNIINLYKYKISLDFLTTKNVNLILSLKNFNIYSFNDIYRSKHFIKIFFKFSYIKTILFCIYSFFNSFVSDLFALILTLRSNQPTYNADTLYYNTYSKNFVHTESNFHSRFVSTNCSLQYLLSITRKNSCRLKCLKEIYSDYNLLKSCKKKFFIIESYGSFYILISSYFSFYNLIHYFSYLIKFFSNDNLTSYKINIKPFLTADAITTGFVDIPKNLYLMNCIKRLPSSIKTLILPVFELSEGRAIVSGCKVRNINVIGHEHSSGGPAHLWRTVVPLEVISKHSRDNKFFLPNKIFCEGTTSISNYSNSGSLKLKLINIGAPRIQTPSKVYQFTENIRPLVIIGEMHNPAFMIKTILCSLSFYCKPIIIRPHPSSIEYLNKHLKSIICKMDNVFVDDNYLSLNDFIQKHNPLLFFCGSSGAAVDILINQFPVVLIESNVYPNCSPYRFFKFPLVLHHKKDISRFIKLYHTKRFFRNKYNTKCFINTQKLISSTADLAISNINYHAR